MRSGPGRRAALRARSAHERFAPRGRACQSRLTEARLELDVAQLETADCDDVTAVQISLLDGLAVDERPVEAAVVEEPSVRPVGDDDRMTTRYRAVVQPQIGRQAAAYVQGAAAARN